MKRGFGLRVVGLALLLAVAAPCSGRPAAEPDALPEAQARIERLVATIVAVDRGGPDDRIPEMADRLQRSLDGDRRLLLQQIVLYLAIPRGNEQAMGAALLLDYLDFTDEEKIAALAPRLDTDDAALRSVMWEVLSTVDRPQGASPDFAPYKPWLETADTAPSGLIRYLYAVSPLDALAITARVYGAADVSVEVVRRASVVDDVSDPGRALREIDLLAQDAAWWVRLYVAHVVAERSGLVSPETLDDLRSDPHPLVREAAAGRPRDPGRAIYE